VDPVPTERVDIYRDVTLAINITFVNKTLIFITVTPGIKFGTVEALLNRQIHTVGVSLKKVVNLYRKRGFRMVSILANNEFEPLRQWFPYLNTCTANEYVLEIERDIRTVKDQSRSTYCMLPFKHLP
jgi:hypothetical protein